MNQEHIHSNSEKIPFQLTRLGKIALVGASVYIGAATVFALKFGDSSPEDRYSPETVTRMVEPGDTVYGIANEVEGSDKHNILDTVDYIKKMPENKDVFEDHKLDQGEILEIPLSAK